MDSITNYLGSAHSHCDDRFVEAENAVLDGLWDKGARFFQEFTAMVEQHFAMEEKILFPAIEAATGNASGPTEIMRNEHEQMRRIVAMLVETIAKRDKAAFLGQCETFNIMVQQHNIKEESILYPMADRILGARAGATISAMHHFEETARS
ncbi:hemerythrin domain-containing protein [Herbaspirillum sp. RV1423]|uniref:hemerythrin domain-containing protein n=1 Tax=Herbaspirillum sp. RV1423 TaxID=1443993 RepID=UPI0004B1CEE6|nr:hemerythrin domain-containing protein [Herbaspirillum sp. RV1423]